MSPSQDEYLLPSDNSSLTVAVKFLSLFVFSLLFRFFFIRKGFIDYSAAFRALNLDNDSGGLSSIYLQLFSQVFKWFGPHYRDWTIPANLISVFFGALATLFLTGAMRLEKRELTIPCAMAFSYLPLPVVISTSFNSAALDGLLLGMVLLLFAVARKKNFRAFFVLLGILLALGFSASFFISLLMFPFIVYAITEKKEFIINFSLFCFPIVLMSLIFLAPVELVMEIGGGMENGYWAFIMQIGDLLLDNFSLPVTIGYIVATGYLFTTGEKRVAICSLIAIFPYLLLPFPLDNQSRLLFPFIAVIVTLSYGVLRFLQNSPGYLFEHYIKLITFIIFFFFVTTPIKKSLFIQFAEDNNRDRELAGQVQAVVGNGRLLAGDLFDCFSFYSYSRPFDIVKISVLQDKTRIAGLEQGLLAWKANRRLAMTSGVRTIFHKASLYPREVLIMESDRTNIYKITDFLSSD